MRKTVSVPLARWQVALPLAGLPVAYAGAMGDWYGVTLLGLALLGILPIHCALCALFEWRMQRRFASLPVEVNFERGPDGERVAFVTRQDGGITSLAIPDDYDPDQDGGAWLIRQVAPDVAELLFGREP